MLLFAVPNWNSQRGGKGRFAPIRTSREPAGTPGDGRSSVSNQRFAGFRTGHQSLPFRLADALNRQDAVDAISPKDAELALVVTAKVDKSAVALAGTGKGDLVHGSHTSPVFVLDHDNRLGSHRC